MKKSIAVICEFNPFHNGHRELFNEIRRRYPTRDIICFMSTEFVQRGEPALIPANIRARSAVLCGASAVLGVPTAYTLAPAQKYAETVLKLIEGTGLCDKVMFATECEDVAKIENAVKNLADPRLEKLLSEKIDSRVPYPVARAEAYKELYGDCGLIEKPNNMLAVEYITAIGNCRLSLGYEAVARSTGDGICSASQMRKMIKEGRLCECEKYTPCFAELSDAVKNGKLRDEEKISSLVLTGIISKVGLQDCADVPQDMPERMKNCAREASGIDDYLKKLSVRHYTASRLKRITYCAALNITKDEWEKLPPYVKLLAADREKTSCLSGSEIRILAKPASAEGYEREYFEREAYRELFAFFSQKRPQSLADAYRTTAEII